MRSSRSGMAGSLSGVSFPRRGTIGSTSENVDRAGPFRHDGFGMRQGRYCGPTRPSRRKTMKTKGGCYCGVVRYVVDGEPLMKAQCHCRECQYITGGAPNMFMVVAPDAFRYTKGE